MVSTELDDFLQEEVVFKPIWRAYLSNGLSVIQDDGRPGTNPSSAWLRLKEYVEQNHIKVTRIDVSFRDNAIKNVVPENAEGYFFINNIVGVMGFDSNFNFYVFGYLKDGVVYTKKIKIPELFCIEEGSRKLEDCKYGLIINSK